MQHFMGPSFATISSVGSNAAIIHYHPQPDSCARLDPELIYLCDSGGQASGAGGWGSPLRCLHSG